jgi:hypothetical protein
MVASRKYILDVLNRLHPAGGGYPHWTVQDNVLSAAHGAVISLADAADLNILRIDIHHGGQLGIDVHNAERVLVHSNSIHHNNTEEFDRLWEAGGMKITLTKTLRVENNEVYNNAGKGLWCDINCTDSVYSKNRIHHNEQHGINLETSAGASVFDNVVWENGYSKNEWVWGAGILSSSSKDLKIYDNILAWNADGISIVSQERPGDCGACVVRNIHVHNNIVLAKDDPTFQGRSLAWAEDWQGKMFDLASDNWGANNRYWYPEPEGRFFVRFESEHLFKKLPEFNESPGESDGRYLTEAQKNDVIGSAKLPRFPEQ